MNSAPAIGVVWMNTGGPADEAGVGEFIRAMLSDKHLMPLPWPLRPWLARRIATRRAPEVLQRYRRVGLPSPVYEHSRRQVAALQEELGDGFAVELGFRYSRPCAADALEHLLELGVKRVVGLAAYPQWSRVTTLTAYRSLEKAAGRLGIDAIRLDSFPRLDGFITSLARAAGKLMREDTTVLFCAHGIPRSLVDAGDPYLEQARETVRAVAERLSVEPRLAFQSRVGRGEWLRPYLHDEIRRLGGEGCRRLLLVPVSFVCENLETLHELDVEAQEVAQQAGIPGFDRAQVPGNDPAFIDGMAAAVRQAAGRAGWEDTGGS